MHPDRHLAHGGCKACAADGDCQHLLPRIPQLAQGIHIPGQARPNQRVAFEASFNHKRPQQARGAQFQLHGLACLHAAQANSQQTIAIVIKRFGAQRRTRQFQGRKHLPVWRRLDVQLQGRYARRKQTPGHEQGRTPEAAQRFAQVTMEDRGNSGCQQVHAATIVA